MLIDETVLKETIADAILDFFCGAKIIEFNAAKWIGFDESLDSYLQHHVVNSLGIAAWSRMLGRDDFFPEKVDGTIGEVPLDMLMIGDVEDPPDLTNKGRTPYVKLDSFANVEHNFC